MAQQRGVNSLQFNQDQSKLHPGATLVKKEKKASSVKRSFTITQNIPTAATSGRVSVGGQNKRNHRRRVQAWRLLLFYSLYFSSFGYIRAVGVWRLFIKLTHFCVMGLILKMKICNVLPDFICWSSKREQTLMHTFYIPSDICSPMIDRKVVFLSVHFYLYSTNL